MVFAILHCRMANPIRLLKSANEWTPSNLDAYNTRVEYRDAWEFFRLGELDDIPFPEVDDDFLAAIDTQAVLELS